MGELNQPSNEQIEFLKRTHGGDGETTMKSTRGNPATGFDTKKITKQPKSYHFTYAQFDPDFELWNRLLKVPVHESESKNRAVGRMAFGHEDIAIDGDAEYGYDFADGTERLQAHVLDIKRHAPKRVVLPNGTTGSFDAWDIVEPIFKHARSESNRVYRMVANLIRASALWNYTGRETISYDVTTDEGDVVTERALVADPQDVANVVACLDALRATTHEIDARKRAIVEAIQVKGGDSNTVEGVEPIVEFLEESDASQVNASELDAILDDLAEDYLIATDGDQITARNWDELGEPRILDRESLFADCVDPIDNEGFVDAYERRRAEKQTTTSELLEASEIDSEGADVVAEETAAIAPDADIADYQRTVLARLSETIDGTVVEDPASVPVEAFLGLVAPDGDAVGVETAGTLLDPEHDVWSQPTKPDTWVTAETQARTELQRTIKTLLEAELLAFRAVDNGVLIDVE